MLKICVILFPHRPLPLPLRFSQNPTYAYPHSFQKLTTQQRQVVATFNNGYARELKGEGRH